MSSSTVRSAGPLGRGGWTPAEGISRQLFEDAGEKRFTISWHDFQVTGAAARNGIAGAEHLEICLNYSGAAVFQMAGGDQTLTAGQVAIFHAASAIPPMLRGSGTLHRFISFQISPAYLQSRCRAQGDLLRQSVQAFLRGERKAFVEIETMDTALLGMRGALLDPPVSEIAREPWYQAKVMELLAHTIYRMPETEELFCHRQRRQNAARVERARYLLERDLENPPSLEMLAKDGGCSPFHLSRIFAQEAGMSIPKFLRMRRIERAAELLRARKMNVTEAAMAVGYSSLSAFNKAFVEQMGCCPGLYPVVKISGRKAAAE
jgi:AraC-like DNA-binding protein